MYVRVYVCNFYPRFFALRTLVPRVPNIYYSNQLVITTTRNEGRTYGRWARRGEGGGVFCIALHCFALLLLCLCVARGFTAPFSLVLRNPGVLRLGFVGMDALWG